MSTFSRSEMEPLPWFRGPSIYTHIRMHLNPITGRLSDDGLFLPDEDSQNDASQLRFAPGAIDGIFSGSAQKGETDEASQIASYVISIARVNSEPAQLSLYAHLVQDNVLSVIDSVISDFSRFGVSPQPYLYNFALALAQNAPDRGPVKFAIALLGRIGSANNKELISILGRHEEFTLYAAVALLNLLDDAEHELWNLAQKVDGWGRIQVVRRLSTPKSPEIRHWLLREGYRNDIMYEYLAYICATGGDLKTALSASTIDDEILNSAGDIISALVSGRGPVQDIDDYQDAAYVVSQYLDHLEGRAMKLAHFSASASILRYLARDDWNDQEVRETRLKNGWTNDNRTHVAEKLERILRAPHWKALVEQGLVSDNNQEFYFADEAASLLHIDTWKYHWARLHANPRQPDLWFKVMRRANTTNIDEIIAFAIDNLPLDEVATGAADALGLGPEFRIHQCLGFIVQDLDRFPGTGWPLIAAALKSPVVNNRNMALRSISKWGRVNWAVQTQEALEVALKVEPHDKVRARIEKVLDGEQLSD